MPENNRESFEDEQPEDIQQMESQLQSEERSSEVEDSENEEKDSVSEKCLLWTNWHFFIVPGRIKEALEKSEKDDEHESKDYERFVPKTKIGRQIGVMQYILNEEGKICIEEMLYIDVVLRRITSFTPQMAGIDRYDEMGVLQLRHGLRRFVEDFFIIAPRRRRKILADFWDSGKFSPEILQAIKRLENLVNLPKAKNPPAEVSKDGKSARYWQDGLTGRDLELFKLLSGIETMSPRRQALSVLNYILPEESSSASSQENESEPIRLEPEDKKRIERLLKRYPALRNRYPYLLKMIENDIPVEEFNADSDSREHLYNSILSSKLFLPSFFVDLSKESDSQSWVSNRYVKWGVIIAVFCSLIKLAGILFNALIK